VVDRLDHAGFVRCERDATDHRKVPVTPVPEALAPLGEQLEAVLNRRDDAQLRVIADFPTELTDSAAGAPTASPPPTGDRGGATTSSSGS
jgi:hypothetical protein